jgi:hypothetical protein
MAIDERDDFPPLGHLELRPHRSAAKPSEAITRLEEYITGSFARAGVTGIAGASRDLKATQGKAHAARARDPGPDPSEMFRNAG